MKQQNAEIIAIGTELLLGQIANTNAQWLSDELASYGINVFYHTVVGDNLSRVHSVFEQAQKRSNLIVVTGGLGPTEDDMTREAFQLMTDLPIYVHEESLDKITAYFKEQNRIMTPNNRKQSHVFKTAQVLNNKAGMAPGMIVQFKGKVWIFLPGVPREMKQLYKDEVRSYLYERMSEKQIIKSMLLRFIGIGEAQLEYELSDLIHSQSNPTIAPLAEEEGIVIRLTVKESSEIAAQKKLEATKQLILNKVGDYCYGVDNEAIERKIVHMLKENKCNIAAAESVTGGLFTDKLIKVEGVTQACPGGVITYDEQIKMEVLGVSEAIIDNYGVVSEQCAIEMAKKVRELFKTDLGISFTGVAGPGSLEGHKIGTVFIGVSIGNTHKANKYVFSGGRSKIRNLATLKGFEILYNLLK